MNTYYKMPLYEAKEHVRRDVAHNASVTVIDWHRAKVNGSDVLFLVVKYTQRFDFDPDIKPVEMYRMAVFVNGKPRIGDYIDAP